MDLLDTLREIVSIVLIYSKGGGHQKAPKGNVKSSKQGTDQKSKPVLPKVLKEIEKFKRVWKPKSIVPDVSPNSSCLNDKSVYSKETHVWMQVTYMNEQGVPTTTMAWVPKTN